MARKGIRERWLGGRVFIDPTGRRTWVIERMRGGKRRAIGLEVTTEQQALAEYALFERDPTNYRTPTQIQKEQKQEVERESLPITPELIDEFAADLAARGRSTRHIKWTVQAYLRQWATALGRRSLKDMSLADLQDCLKGKAGVRKRIVAIKSLTHFLRRTGRLLATEDPTVALQLPPIRPEKSRHQKGHTMEEVAAVYQVIKHQEIRDCVTLHARCGMHGTEIERIAQGEGTIRILEGHGEIAGSVSFGHKAGHTHVNSLTADALGAALRLQARGSAPSTTWIRRHIIWVAKKAGIQPVAQGALRHSYVNWCFEHGREVRATCSGVPLQNIAAAIGHHSVTTTSRFYLGTQVIPPLIATPLVLQHPDDPPLAQLIKSPSDVKPADKEGKSVCVDSGPIPPGESHEKVPRTANALKAKAALKDRDLALKASELVH